MVQGQVVSDHGWLVILSRPGRSRGDGPGVEAIGGWIHKRRALNARLSSGTAGTFACPTGPYRNCRGEAGTKYEPNWYFVPVQKNGSENRSSRFESRGFLFQGVQVRFRLLTWFRAVVVWPWMQTIRFLSNFYNSTAHLIFRSLLQGQTLRGLTPQNNPAKNPTTLKEPRKDGQMSTLLSREIWPQGCEKSDASNVRFESHLASHSPVAKSPYWAELIFVHLCDVPPVLRGFLLGYCAGSILARFDPAKDSANKASGWGDFDIMNILLGFDDLETWFL